MNYCPNCGSRLKTELTYCTSCGFVYREGTAAGFGDSADPEEKISGSYEEAARALDEEAETRKGSSDPFSGRSGSDPSSNSFESKTRSFHRESEPNYGTGYMETAPKTNVYGIVSLVCGIVGIPLFFMLLIPNILAIVFGIMGLVFAKNNISTKGTSIAGIVLGSIVILFFLLAVILAASLFTFAGAVKVL